MTGVVQGSDDVGGGEAGKGSEVTGRLNPGIQPPDLPDRGRPGPEAQL